MHKNKHFNFHRFVQLLKKEAHFNLKRNLLIIGAMYSLYTIVMALVFEFGEGNYGSDVLESLHFITFTSMLFTGGVFITSFCFMELRNKMTSHFYLLTPCSNLEKFIANLMISLIGYMLFMLISYLVYSWSFNWIVLKIYDVQFSPLQVYSKEFLFSLNIFILVHSIYFLGSISFKKYPIILTPIASFVIIATVSLFNELIIRIVFANQGLKENFSEMEFDIFFEQYEYLVKFILFYVFPLILWFTTYLKLNEKEY